MFLERLSLRGFRNYVEADLVPAPDGVTLVHGDNGAGKTNLLEAVYYAGNLRSFRGAPAQALVHNGSDQAVVRAAADRQGRSLLVEIELNLQSRDRVRLNRQALRRTDDLISTVLVTVFSPDDIEIVKGGPQARRDFVDDLAELLHPKYRSLRAELDRVVRQRNALLRSSGGSLRPGMAGTLDVWDAKLADAGQRVVLTREATVAALSPEAASAYQALARQAERPESSGGGPPDELSLGYERSWQGALLTALQRARDDDVRRGVTTVGPQRDDLSLTIGKLTARTQASQGEQRSTALALRLAAHRLVTSEQGSSPVLLLDDIFSELDAKRSAALADCLPPGQAIVTTAAPVPQGLPVERAFRVHAGKVGALSL